MARLSAQRKQELIKLVLVFSAILVFTPHLVRMIGLAYQSRGLTFHGIWAAVYVIDVGEGVSPVLVLPFAVYLGLLALILIDDMKRLQGVLLVVGTGIAIAVLTEMELFFTDVNWFQRPSVLAVGFAAGLLLGGGRKFLNQEPPYQFRKSIRRLFYLISLLVIVGFFEYHVQYPSPLRATNPGVTIQPISITDISIVGTGLVTDASIGLIYLWLLHTFTEYEDRKNFIVLGPQRSGKTTLMAGLLDRVQSEGAEQSGRQPLEWSEALGGFTERIRQEGFSGIPPNEPRQAIPLYFNYIHGRLFKRLVEVRTIDYAGELVSSDLYRAVVEHADKGSIFERTYDRLGWWLYRAGQTPVVSSIVASEEEEEDSSLKQLPLGFPYETFTGSPEQIEQLVARTIHDSESMIVIIPLDDFAADQVNDRYLPEYYTETERADRSQYLEVYGNLLSTYSGSEEQKEVIIVATMADLVVEHFKDTYDVEDVHSAENWRKFREYITRDILGANITQLEIFTSHENVFPVYYDMDPANPVLEDRTGPEPNPKRPNLQVWGAKELLDELGS